MSQERDDYADRDAADPRWPDLLTMALYVGLILSLAGLTVVGFIGYVALVDPPVPRN